MIAVLGSGFGLYGYLPALAGIGGQQVILPLRYRSRFQSRAELAPFAPSVVWAADDEDALDRADGAVIALRPGFQPEKVRLCLGRPNIRRLVIEKPLAPTEPEATALLETLARSQLAFRIGYTLCLTPWADRLRETYAVGAAPPLQIQWRFMAHHFRHNQINWKSAPNEGGGPLRFYGIHALALFAELGYDRVETSTFSARHVGEIDSWIATLSGPGRSTVEITVDTRSDEESFVVSTGTGPNQRVAFRGHGPFDDVPEITAFAGIDRRVPLLHRLFGSFEQDDRPIYQAYDRTQELWRQAEDAHVRSRY